MKLNSNLKDLLLYLIVGGVATLAEWGIFWLFDSALAVHYTASTVIAYLLSTFVNWAAGRLLVFKESHQPFWQEILKIYLAAIAGLLMNLAIMFVSVDLLHVMEMLSKILATAIVFLFNFLIRKLYIYKKHEETP
jgi:putative flippase GtrA